MAKYIVKRVAMGIFSVFIVATLTFFIMNLVPGGPFVAEKSISKAAQQALAEKYGLDKPLGVQYLNYMNSLIHGDMGLSLKQRGRTVNQIIFSKLPVSARTAGLAVVVALCVGIPLGCLSAYNRGKWADNLIIVFATCGIAIPSFISSVVLLYTFGMNLKLLPTVGLNEPAAYIMPVTALAIYPTAYITRLMRSSLLDVMGQDYMRTARAKGVSSVKILFKHALRNAILPVITYVGPMLAGLMTGSFVVEKIFSIPGLGRDFVSAITNRDYVANTIMQGIYTPATALVGPGIVDNEGYFMDNANGGKPYISDDYEANLEEAKQLMTEAGYPDGEGFPVVEYSANDAGYHIPVAEYVQQAWGELGITVNINKVEWASFLPMRRAGDYDISRNGWSMDYNDPSNMLELFTTNNGNNDGKYANPAFDKLIEESRVADKATHFEKLHEAEDMLMADAACIPVAYYNDFWLQSPSLKGTWHSPYGYWYLQYGYIEE